MHATKPDSSRQLAQIASFGCQPCQKQHLKCDRRIPTCGRCSAAGKVCKRGYKFRTKSGPFTRKQAWVKIPKHLIFLEDDCDDDGDVVYEDDDYSEDCEDGEPGEHGGDGGQSDDSEVGEAYHSWNRSGARQLKESPSRTRHHASARVAPPQRHRATAASVTPTQTQSSALQLSNGLEPVDDDLSAGLGELFGPYISEQLPLPPPPLPPPAPPPPLPLMPLESERRLLTNKTSALLYPLQNQQEAMLVRHFTQNLAIWLDICEPAQPFGLTVPRRAARCGVLLNAILALAAKHLAHTTAFDRYASDRYHKLCLEMLIPMLSDEATAADEELFAATIILRVWEEMEIKHCGFDSQGYLLGIHAFVHGHGHQIVPDSLSAACFWVGLRQEIYTAIVNHQPIKLPLVPSLAARARELSSVTDHDWANCAVVHCVDVLNFCFGDSDLAQTSTWDTLSHWNCQWKAQLRPSYTPLMYREREMGEAFPEIMYLTSWHVTGVQHHILAELFLVSFDPRMPRIGQARREATKRMDDRVRDLVRSVCGIGLSNEWTPPGMFTACMAIAAFGDRFHERSDQEALLTMLQRTEKQHGRPTETVQQQMMEAWDWSEKQ